MKRAIIVDDVENARISLRKDLEDYCSNIEIVGEADGVVAGAKIIKELKPDILFLDIQMNDGSGFDLLEIIGEVDFKVIFTTSSNEFAIKAFKFSAVDYLLKPVDPLELQDAVEKAGGSSNQLETLKYNMDSGLERLALNSQDKIKIVKVSDIVRCESSGSYTLFYMNNNEEVLVTKTLKEYDALLSEHGFIRVHQTHLVNLDYIKEFIKSDGGYLMLSNGNDIPVSSRKKSEVMKFLSGVN